MKQRFDIHMTVRHCRYFKRNVLCMIMALLAKDEQMLWQKAARRTLALLSLLLLVTPTKAGEGRDGLITQGMVPNNFTSTFDEFPTANVSARLPYTRFEEGIRLWSHKPWMSVFPEEPLPPKQSLPPLKQSFPKFDQSVYASTTEKPSKRHGYVLLAQSFYVMIYVRGDYTCNWLIVQEKIGDYLQRKDCLNTFNKNWFWTYPWMPENIHELLVRVRFTRQLLFVEEVKSLPDAPPKGIEDLEVTTGIGWMQLKFTPAKEPAASLNGYLLVYTTDAPPNMRRVVDVMSQYVVYDQKAPFVRPTHPCKSFLNKTSPRFCILALDHFYLRNEKDTSQFDVKLYTYRVQPGPLKLVEVKAWKQSVNQCWWHAETCPVIDDPGVPAKRLLRRTQQRTKDADELELASGLQGLMPFSNQSSRSPATLRAAMHEDLGVLFLALTLIVLLVLAPCVYFLGKRAGVAAASDRWARMASAAGTVSVPLGHGGAYWRGRSSLPPPIED